MGNYFIPGTEMEDDFNLKLPGCIFTPNLIKGQCILFKLYPPAVCDHACRIFFIRLDIWHESAKSYRLAIIFVLNILIRSEFFVRCLALICSKKFP